MTRVEALAEEIEKLTEEEKAELRRRLNSSQAAAELPKKGKYTFDDIHRRLFPNGPPPKRTIEEMREAVDEEMRERYARR